jgi:hypothetical protein
LIFIKESVAASGQTAIMQRLAHITSCLILALALVLTGPGGAGPANGAIMVTLCAGDTAETIWLDADGNPVIPGADHAKCPDCLLFAAPLPRAFGSLPRMVPARLPAGPTLPVATAPWQIAHLRPDPRGPPLAPTDVRHQRDLRHSIWFQLQPTMSLPDLYQVAQSARATA